MILDKDYDDMERFYKYLLGIMIFTIVILLVIIFTGAIIGSSQLNLLQKEKFYLQHIIVENGCAEFETNPRTGEVKLKWKENGSS